MGRRRPCYIRMCLKNPLLKLVFYLSLYLLGIFKIEFKVPTFRTYSGMDLAKILFENSLLCYL